MGNWKDNWTKDNALKSSLGMLGGATSIFGSAYNLATPNTDSLEQSVDAQVKAMRQNQQGVQANSLDDLMGQWTAFKPMSTDFNSNNYYVGPSDGSIFTNTLSSTVSGATAGALAGPIGAAVGGAVGLGSGIIGGLIGQNKAKNAANDAAAKLKAEAERQNAYKLASFETAAQGLNSKNNRMLASQIAAYGGPLGINLLPVNGAIDYMQNEELLSLLEENMIKNNNSRMPTFAFGGALPGYGGDWSNGLNFIKAGKRHEQNPIGGVPMGVAQDGTPNLVEEGEVIWNDYVFSNRITVPKAVRNKFKLKGGDNMTFAEAVEKAQKASAERPNDPIEKRTLNTLLTGLMQEQETIRQKKAEEEQFNQLEGMAAFAADGGPIHIAKNKKGTFTAAATKHGMGVQEFANHVLSNKDKYTSTMIKKANFAHNAKSWSHADGGPIDLVSPVQPVSYSPWSSHYYPTQPESYLPNFSDAVIPPETSKNIKLSPDYYIPHRYMSSATADRYASPVPYTPRSSSDYTTYPREDISRILDSFDYLKSFNLPLGQPVSYPKSDMSLFSYLTIPPETPKNSQESLISAYNNPTDPRLRPITYSENQSPLNFTDGSIKIPNNNPSVDAYNKATNLNSGNSTLNPTLSNPSQRTSFGEPVSKSWGLSDWSNWGQEGVNKTKRLVDLATKTPLLGTTGGNEETDSSLPTSGWENALRYAPIVGGIGTVFSDLMGWTNKPDYQYADAIDAAAERAANNYTHVSPTMLGDYLAYNPFDRLFYANELGAQQAATRRGILNLSNGNRGTALASLLAADYNGNINLGKLYREGEEYNLAQRQKVAEFNRGTNMYNSEADLKAQTANAEIDRARANLLYEAALKSNSMRQQEDQASTAAKAANLNNLFDNLGNFGVDAYNRYDRNALINAGVFGTLSQKPQGVSDEDWEAYKRVVGRENTKDDKKAYGGKLKRRKGLTI